MDASFLELIAECIIENGAGSTSLIQRRFGLGYNQATRVMNLFENAGVLGASSGSKPRELLIKDIAAIDFEAMELMSRNAD